MKLHGRQLVAGCMAGVLALGLGGTGISFAQSRGMDLAHIKGSNQELVAMLEQTNPETYVAHDDIIITQPQFEEIGAKAVEVTQDKSSDYEKVVAIKDWVNKHIAYDYDNSVKDQNAYTAFIEGEGICQAYSNLTKAMLSYLEIPCILVNGDSAYGGHAWNMAYVEDGWIFVDSTWGAIYDDVDTFSKDHKPYFSDSLYQTVGDYAFTYHNGVAVCDYLGSETHWDIPDTFYDVPTTALAPKLFNDEAADKIQSISFPETLKNIDNIDYAFDSFSSLTQITVDQDNPYFTAQDGVLYDNDIKELLVYPAAATRTQFQIPDTVTTLGECVFRENAALKDILIPPSVTQLGKDLFHSKDVTIYAQAGSAAAQYATDNGLTLKDMDQFPQTPTPPEEVDTTLLEKTVAYALTLSTDGVTTSAKKAFEQALANAQAVLAKENPTQEEVNAAWDALLEGIWGLGITQGDKSTLEQLITKAESMVEGKYVPQYWGMLETALVEARAMMDNGDALDEDIQPVADNLLNAILAQRLKANKENLEDLLGKAENIDLDGYTAESVAEFQAALATVQTLMADETISVDDQDTVDAAAARLAAAMDGLTAQQPQESEKPEASQTPEATDKPQATQKPEQVPQTGDASQLTAMVGVLLTSATALGGLAMTRKRRNG